MYNKRFEEGHKNRRIRESRLGLASFERSFLCISELWNMKTVSNSRNIRGVTPRDRRYTIRYDRRV